MVSLGLVSNRGVNSRPTPYHDKVRKGTNLNLFPIPCLLRAWPVCSCVCSRVFVFVCERIYV